MIFLNKTYKFFLWVLATILLFGASACSDNDTVPDREQNGTYQLLISLSLPESGSRADNPVLVPGNDDENYLGNLTFCLYYNGSFLMDLTKWFTLGYKYVFLISTNDFKAAFENIPNVEFSSDLLEQPNFQVLATANWQGYNDAVFAEDLTVLWKNNSDYNFIAKNGDSHSAWVPIAVKEDGIPMFGLSEKGKFSSWEFDVKIPMLRSLAKFEIIDVMNVPNKDYPYSISGVTLSKSAANGRLIPDGSENQNPGWNINETQVVTPSLPKILSTVENILLVPTKENLTYAETVGERNKWICYVPEMDLTDETFRDAVFNVGLNETDTEAKLSLKEAIKTMTQNDYVLRNNKYRFFITGLKDTGVEFRIVIDPHPYGDINYIYYGGNKWWIHKETETEKEFEVWYKYVDAIGEETSGHWEKEWRYFEGSWQKWNGSEWDNSIDSLGPFESQTSPDDKPSVPDEPSKPGIYSNEDFNVMINSFLGQSDYDEVGRLSSEYFKNYGEKIEINGEEKNCLMLYTDVILTQNDKVIPIHRDYILYGNGHTVQIDIHTGPDRYNIGELRDIYIQRPNNLNRLYIDKDGNIWRVNGNDKINSEPDGLLPGLIKEKNARSYDVYTDGRVKCQSSHFSGKISGNSVVEYNYN